MLRYIYLFIFLGGFFPEKYHQSFSITASKISSVKIWQNPMNREEPGFENKLPEPNKSFDKYKAITLAGSVCKA